MFDYVIAGGGTAGCVLANRLSEDPGVKVCLLEAGPADRHPLIHAPIGILWMMRSKVLNWNFETEAEPALGGRRLFWPRGRTLGGSSSSNAMCYIRGHAQDYDEWAALGNRGWSFAEVLPYFKRSEHQERGASAFHGVGGPLNVADARSPNELSHVFTQACAEVGVPVNQDFNGAEQEGAGLYQVMQKEGRRCSAARGYLDPARSRPNLTIITEAHTCCVIFEGTQAVGVEYQKDGQRHTARAKQEVLLAAGVMQSPQLLMLSGVGPRETLQKLNIPVVTHLPGVGQNLQDHLDVTMVQACTQAVSYGITWRTVAAGLPNWFRYLTAGKGMFTSNGAEATAFIKSTPDEAVPDLQFQFVPARMRNHGLDFGYLCGDGYSLHVCQLRPKSRGEVTITSTDPFKPVSISPRFLSHPDDLETMLKGVKWTRKIMGAHAFDAYRGVNMVPGDQVTSDADLRQFIRDKAESIYHPVGTCKMGHDALAVVDDELRVHGLQGLRVVDASVMPLLVGGNTTAPTVMIAEKASDLIKASARQAGMSTASVN